MLEIANESRLDTDAVQCVDVVYAFTIVAYYVTK